MAADHNTLTLNGKNIHEVLQYTTGVEHLKQLLEQGERPCDECFVLAARNGSFKIVSKLLEVDPSGINTKDQNGKALLSYFSWDINNLLKLLKMGANPLVSDIETVLKYVIVYSQTDEQVIDIFKILLCAGVNINTFNCVPLLKLLVTKPTIFNKLLDLGLNPNIPEIQELMIILLKPNIVNHNIEPILVEIFTKLSNLGIYLVKEDEILNLLKYCVCDTLLIRLLIQSGVPLVHNVQRVLRILVSKCDLTSDQTDQLYYTLTLFAKNRYKLVDEHGCSLVKYCSNEDMLLHLLRLGADPHVPEIHRHLGTHIYTEKLKEIYSIAAAAGVKLVDERDRTIIHYNDNYPDNIRYLLKLGASPFYKGKNLLKNALRSTRDLVNELKSYIESGFNVMEKDRNGCTFLCTAIKICIERYMDTESLELVRCMLMYPDISDKNFLLTCESGYHPQEIVTKHCRRLCNSVLVNMVLNSKFKEPYRLITNIRFHAPGNIFVPADMSLISYYVNSVTMYHDAEDMFNDIDYLRQHGFSVNGPGVSPLTVALISRMDPKTAVEFFVQRGVNVEMRALQYKDPVLQDWKESLKVPDAAVVAAYKGSLLDILQVLVPHIAFPPLALLLFKPSFRNNKQKLALFCALLREGRVPHGTLAYQAIRDKVREMSDVENNPPTQLLPIELEIPEHIGGINSQQLTMFDVAHRSPLSLLELSWVAVRMQLADTSAGSDTQSLAQLFTPLLPPVLTDEVIRDLIAQVRKAEDKWLTVKPRLLENPCSLLFVNSVLSLSENEEIRAIERPCRLYGGSMGGGNYV